MKYLFYIILIFFLGCNFKNIKNDNSEKPHYKLPESTLNNQSKSIYGKLSIQEIIDSLYKDTLVFRNSFDTTKVDTFYLKQINKLVQKIKEDNSDKSSLFPGKQFDKVIARDSWINNAREYFREHIVYYGSEKVLTKDQAEKLLKLINNPLNFDWSECGTWTPSSRFDFFHKGKLINTINVGCTDQFRVDFEKIKFGHLIPEKQKEFEKLCSEIGIINDGSKNFSINNKK